MNGRVYDYNLGRFMSVDPFIQSPLNSQSLNPYTYIMNNPMAGVDPTGYVAQGTNASNWRTSGCDLDPMGCTSTPTEKAFSAYVGSGESNMHQSFSDNLEKFNNRMEQQLEDNWTDHAYAGLTSATITDLPSGSNVDKVDQVASGTGGKGTPASVPDEIKIEASGFKTQEEAAIAAGAQYGEEGVKNKQELQLAIVRVGKDEYGYLTPGWGPSGAAIINPGDLFDAYKKAGFDIASWMHGHWDGQLNFSANDFGLVWKKTYPTFMVNRKLEVRKLTNKHLKKAFKSLPANYKKLELKGLINYYGHDGLPGEKL
nr:RHS repeat-associated core domain-containing protein [Pseudoalteromonas sp. T1lg21]